MVETRAQAQGKPLKKPGAYNTDAYYQEKDEGYGDVGVDQEPDAGAIDNPSDPDFKVSAAEVAGATEEATRDPEGLDMSQLKEEVADLQRPADTGVEELDARGEPVPIVEAGAPGGGPSIQEQEQNVDAGEDRTAETENA
ncbi:hypothetical protein CHLRE_12g544300v5 [Chlamydomonas reinhardtii]|uniref:Uncharacterized protein n=1 Tax=Chlamydomonas reinhardtii TaxID=3055 RepID=A0A2K3D6M9_CHLRE|nr:uncharacterized protein CHLRE_12g544300v5 [Chlamydomonas reinhardtii]XP_042919136.1 uncharacterized protein CHLRE_12g544300v5 [Chlamydomonas reinhardtii]PNW76187.1 hypothetical protein CHLRE_12g544300v5 [Chlamydomonas reinhardtii]PNW76188.1 hypothetical protein CHLRE_12g544300v5 [Chlamydomonas reinhardtii]